MKRSLLAAGAAVGLASVLMAAPADAGSGSVNVKDFYWTGSCSITAGLGGSVQGRLTVTNYDKIVSGVQGQEYHYNWYAASGWNRYSIKFDGVADTVISEGYFPSTNYVDKKTISVTWRSSAGEYKACTVKPNPM